MISENSQARQLSFRDIKSTGIYLLIAAVSYLLPVLPDIGTRLASLWIPTWFVSFIVFMLGILGKKFLTDYSTQEMIIKSE